MLGATCYIIKPVKLIFILFFACRLNPLSFASFQRVSEYMNYAYLLRKASTLDEAEVRIQWVATFAVSALASNFERMGKPFNPLLGETYELQRPDFRILCEQVGQGILTEGEGSVRLTSLYQLV